MLCGKYKSRQYQTATIGMESSSAEELFMYRGHGSLRDRKSMFNLLYLLKQAPPYKNAGVVDGSADRNWRTRMWLTLGVPFRIACRNCT